MKPSSPSIASTSPSGAAGISLACDRQGNVLRVIRDDLDVPDLVQPGCPAAKLLDGASSDTFRNFLVELRDRGAAFDWEVSLSIRGTAVSVHLAGVQSNDELRIAMATRCDDLCRLLPEMMGVDNERATARRSLANDGAIAVPDQRNRGHELLDEMSRLNNELVVLQRDLAGKNAELQRLNAEVQRLAVTDALTRIWNRRGFFDLGRHEMARARRHARPLSLVMFDLDDFKRVNDTRGRGTGDQVLEEVAARCRSVTRQVDVLGRYGGEEFVILLPDTSADGALLVAERLRLNFSATPVLTSAGPIPITISLGVSVLAPDVRDLETLIERADRLLCQAKEAGRNRIAMAPSRPSPATL